MWRKKRSTVPETLLKCQDVRAHLERYLDGRLSAAAATAFEAHLAGCAECRQLVREEPLWLGSLRQSPPRARLTEQEAGAIRQGLYRSMRWRMIVRNTKTTLQGAAAFAALILVVGLFFWWQQQGDRVATLDPQPSIPAAGGAAPAGGETTITLAVEDANLAAYRPLIEQFEAQHANIRVRLVAELEIVGSEETNRIAALASAADVFPYSPDTEDARQYLLDLQPLLSADPAFQPDDFLPGLLNNDSSLWSLPIAASYPLVYFDKIAFDAAGLVYPQPGWSLEEMLAATQALTQREGDEVVQWGYVPFQVQPLLAAQLAAPLVVDGEARLTDPDVVDALAWIAGLFTTHQVSPWLESYKPFAQRQASGDADPFSLVREGRAAMWSADHTLWQFGFGGEDIGLTTMPRGQQGYAAGAVRYGFAISRGTTRPQAAWELLTFLSDQPPVDGVLELLVPARRSVAAAEDFWGRVPAVMAEPLRYAVDNNTSPRLTPSVVDTLQGALTGVVTEHQTVAEALNEADASGLPSTTGPAEPEAQMVATPPGEVTATSILFTTSGPLYEAHQELARAFNETHTDFRVTVRRIDTGNDFHREIAGADCFAAISSRLVGINAYARPVNALLDLDAVISVDDFYPAAISALTSEGELLGLPGQVAVPLIAYNRDLFAAAGVAEPPLDWTLAEFLEIAQALTNPSIEQYGFIDWSQTTSLYSGLSQFGIEPISARDGVATVNFAAMAPVVRWYADLTHLYGVHPTLPGDLVPWEDFFDRHDLFRELVRNNQVAMWPTEATMPDDFAHIDFGLVPLPIGPSGYRSSLADGLTAYFIAQETPHAVQCWQWLTHLVTQPAAVSANSVPAHMATAQSAAFAGHAGAEKVAPLLAAAAGGQEQAAWYGQLEPWLAPAMILLESSAARAARGEVDVDSTLAAAADNFALYRECVIERQAFDNAAEWQACAVEVDPDLRRRYE